MVNGVKKVLGLGPSCCIPRFSISTRLSFTNSLPQSLNSKHDPKDVDVLFAHDVALTFIRVATMPKAGGLEQYLADASINASRLANEVAAPECDFCLGIMRIHFGYRRYRFRHRFERSW